MVFCFNSFSKLKHIGTVTLETDRFILRKFNIKDVHDIFVNWSSDYDSAKYNAWSVHESEKETESYVSEWIDSYKRLSYYHWAIVDKNNNEVIGSVSVSNVKTRKKYCEIGYTVAKKMWNQGIATEVVICVIKFLTENVGFEIVRAMHHKKNTASGRVMEKVGMYYIKDKVQFFLSGNNLIMNCSIYEYKR